MQHIYNHVLNVFVFLPDLWRFAVMDVVILVGGELKVLSLKVPLEHRPSPPLYFLRNKGLKLPLLNRHFVGEFQS